MISVIISSANSALLTQVSKNIEGTISVPFELISFDNSGGQKGICEIYNLGIKKAQYEILCFMHEDIEIKTENWGQIVINQFNSYQGLGLLGVAGSSYKTLTPCGWHDAGSNTNFVNYIQSHKASGKASVHYYVNPHNEKIARVACVDGVWFCTTKKIASEFMFDENTFKKFHGYDIDFSLAAGQKYKVAITYEVLLDHFSEGSYNKEWMDDNLKLHTKWSRILPVNVGNLPSNIISKIEKKTFKNFIDQLLQFNYPISIPLSVLVSSKRFLNLDPLLFLKLKYYIFLKYLKARKVTKT